MDNRTIGVVGGGESARFLVEAGNRLGVRLAVLDKEGSSSSAGQLASLCLEGSPYHQPHKLLELGAISDLLTVTQGTSLEPLRSLSRKGLPVFPNVTMIETLQNVLLQKQFLQQKKIPVAAFAAVECIDDVLSFAHTQGGFPVIIKRQQCASSMQHEENARRKRSLTVRSEAELEEAVKALGEDWSQLLVEECVSFAKELAVAVVRTKEGLEFAYPIAEVRRLLTGEALVIAPAQIPPMAAQTALDTVTKTVAAFSSVGVFCVRLFLLPDDSVAVNEVVAHPHRFGNFTLYACDIDQYEIHLRALLGLVCFPPSLNANATAVMDVAVRNSDPAEAKLRFQRLLHSPKVSGRWYDKHTCVVGQAMGHVAVTARDIFALREKLETIEINEKDHGIGVRPASVSIVLESEYDHTEAVQIINVLQRFKVTHEVTMISPHRTPTKLYTFAQGAAERGVQIIIAFCGSSGVLPGMIASLTTLPVIACSDDEKHRHTNIASSLHSPAGVPVAVVASGNAAYLAVRVLALRDSVLTEHLEQHAIIQEEEVLKASASDYSSRHGKN